MTKIAYLECPTGIAGDMCLGALVHGGVPLEYLIEKLKLLGITHEFRLWAEQVHRNGQQATKVHVELANGIQEEWGDAEVMPIASPSHAHAHDEHLHSHNHPHDRPSIHSHEAGSPLPQAPSQTHAHEGTRHLPEIERLIKAAGLPDRAERWSLAVFRRLAEAEGAVHGIAPEQVHFHEVGATDAIVDIVGTCLGLDWLDIDQLYCSALPIGGGTIWAAHGRLPVPAPAVLKLWEMRQVPLYSNGIDRELVTPTGAAIVTTLATHFGAIPPMTLQRVGLGAGSRNFLIPNILRLWIGENQQPAYSSQASGMTALSSSAVLGSSTPGSSTPGSSTPDSSTPGSSTPDTVSVLETQIDDLNPQAIGYLFEVLLTAGALDVFTQAIGMKKSRPGILLTVICRPEQMQACQTIIFRETTTLGIRYQTQQRAILQREFHTVETQYGKVRLKIARWQKDGAIVNVQPEYEDCAHIAQHNHLPWREVHYMALQAWQATSRHTPDLSSI